MLIHFNLKLKRNHLREINEFNLRSNIQVEKQAADLAAKKRREEAEKTSS